MQECFSERHGGDVHEAVDIPVCTTLHRYTYAPLALRMPGIYGLNVGIQEGEVAENRELISSQKTPTLCANPMQ